MNDSPSPSDSVLDDLFARARRDGPATTRQEYAFETRLLARLRESRGAPHAWAAVSWRLIPFLTVLVLALVLWQAETISTAREQEQIASGENPEAVDLWNSFN
jgi:hypothetical protein